MGRRLDCTSALWGGAGAALEEAAGAVPSVEAAAV